MSASAAKKLTKVLEVLGRRYGSPERPPTTDPFELILYENIAYLARPDKRRAAFELLQSTVGTSAPMLLKASQKSLQRVTSHGILPATFADKLRECAHILIEECQGDLGPVVRSPIKAAKKALQKFPGIGEPGAEKILLFSGMAPLLGLDSNGLRVLTRLGLIADQKSYVQTYAASQELAGLLKLSIAQAQSAHLLLQEHGRVLCKRSKPRCSDCPLVSNCAFPTAE